LPWLPWAAQHIKDHSIRIAFPKVDKVSRARA